jgi:tetratricopeptide (TPR) repeat protein
LDLAEGLLHLGVVLWMEGDLAGAQGVLEEVLELAPYETAPRLHMNALGNLANIFAQKGDYDRAEACFHETLRYAQSLGDQRTLVTILNNWGAMMRNRGDYARARELYLQARALLQSLHDGMCETVNLHNLGDLAMLENDFEAARDFFLQSIEKAHRYQQGWFLHYPLTDLAQLTARMGNFREAIEWQQQALHAYLLHYAPEHAEPLLMQLSFYALQAGEVEAAARWLLLAANWTRDSEKAKGLHQAAAELVEPSTLQQLQADVANMSVQSLLNQLASDSEPPSGTLFAE